MIYGSLNSLATLRRKNPAAFEGKVAGADAAISA
jgi:hypothetical protein